MQFPQFNGRLTTDRLPENWTHITKNFNYQITVVDFTKLNIENHCTLTISRDLRMYLIDKLKNQQNF
jgi:hypothetical protein